MNYSWHREYAQYKADKAARAQANEARLRALPKPTLTRLARLSNRLNRVAKQDIERHLDRRGVAWDL